MLKEMSLSITNKKSAFIGHAHRIFVRAQFAQNFAKRIPVSMHILILPGELVSPSKRGVTVPFAPDSPEYRSGVLNFMDDRHHCCNRSGPGGEIWTPVAGVRTPVTTPWAPGPNRPKRKKLWSKL